MTFATFVLSTGRCGTQWLASSLARLYPDVFVVEHEPLPRDYQPRKALGLDATSDESQARPSEVIAHLDNIERLLESKSYVECGHPCWSTIPFFAARLPSKIRVIHLTRHPVPTCCSWLTHGAFQAFSPHLPPKTLLSPFDEGVRFTEYQQNWETLTPFEKCLYYWAEVNAFALDLQSRWNPPWLQLRYEDLFGGDGHRQLLDFLELPCRDEIVAQKSEKIDQFRYLSGVWQDWRIVHQHPQVISVARRLGYDLNEPDETALRGRYLEGRM